MTEPADPKQSEDKPKHPKKDSERALWRAASLLLVTVIIISLGTSIILMLYVGLKNSLDELDRVSRGSAVISKERFAELMFNTCAKDLESITLDKRADFQRACAGYETLDRAYETEGVEVPS